MRARWVVFLAWALVGCAPAAADVVTADHQISVPESVAAEPGVATSVSLTVAAKPGYTISRDGPLIIDIAGDGLTLPKRRYRRSDAADARAADPRFDIKLTAPNPGDHALAIDARFWICRRRTCRPIRENLTVAIKAAPKPPPTDAGSQL